MPHDDHGRDGGRNSADGRDAPAGLTKNEKLVWDVLCGGDEPLKAYEILDRLKGRGVRAPMTIYRALEGLVEKGIVHKLDAFNSFVLCMHEAPHDMQAFLVCDGCASVAEIEIELPAATFAPWARRANFDMRSARVEVRGHCHGCAQEHSQMA
jgi:Fur family zinc uptake transcriptional regulator